MAFWGFAECSSWNGSQPVSRCLLKGSSSSRPLLAIVLADEGMEARQSIEGIATCWGQLRVFTALFQERVPIGVKSVQLTIESRNVG